MVPWLIMATLSHSSSTSNMLCDDIITEVPSLATCLMISLTSYALPTSSPDVTSSRIASLGPNMIALAIAKLGDRIDSKVDSYSKGMKRRLLIARAIMFGPKLAIMDEVTSGLDVGNAYEVREIIRQVAGEGTSVIISSHNMFEVELLCERVAMINHGAIVLEGTPQELKERYGADNLEEVFMKAVKL